MSNALAIATVTRALAHVVETAARKEVNGANVITARPDTAAANGAAVHLFLYQVLADAAQRNNDLPTRSSDGALRQRPTIVLNLHYLLTFNGSDTTLEPHRMLGAVSRDLNTQPVMSRSLIRSVSNGELAKSNLADAIDVVRVTLLPLNVEDLSKIWLMFSQIPYSLSIAYEARVVLIESEESAGPVLPVLYRGPADRGPETVLGPYPSLEDYEITAPGAPLQGPRLPSYPRAQLGLQVAFQGRNLGSDTVTLRFTHPRLGDLDIPIPPADRNAEQIRVVIPQDVAAQTAWAAGIYLVSARLTGGGVTRSSNELPLPFAPAFTAIVPASPIAGAGTDLALTLTCSPQIASGQRAVLMVGGSETSVPPPAAQTNTLAFTLPKVPAVTNEFVYLRVDGVDSFAFKQQGTPPKFVLDDSKRITIT
jgi:Pvc16 N-terminal domain